MLFGGEITKQIRKENGSHTYRSSAYTPERRRMGRSSRKVSLCTFGDLKRGSFTVEAALALPLFLLAAVCMISFQELYRVETICRVELCEAVMSAGMIRGQNPEIVLADTADFEPAGGLLPSVHRLLTVRAHAWTGLERRPAAVIGSAGEEMVYITEGGNKYHRIPGCYAINKGVEAIPGGSIVGNRYGGKTYTACGVCSKGELPAALVYITKSGNRYHNKASCSTIAQAAIMIRKSEAEGRGPCSLCYP